MRRGAPLRRGKPMRRGKPLRYRSGKTAALYVKRRRVVAGMLAEILRCQIQWDEGCQGRSTDIHEPRMRSRGADICNPAECVAACRYCHDKVHANPAESTGRGWLVPSGQRTQAVPP